MMGFMGDLYKLNKQAKELDKDFHPGQQMQDSLAQMRAMNESMEMGTKALADGVAATAQVVSVGMSTTSVNMNPVLPVELMLQQEGMLPRPVSLSLVVPMAYLPRVQPGQSLPVRVSTTDPSAVAVDWAAMG